MNIRQFNLFCFQWLNDRLQLTEKKHLLTVLLVIVSLRFFFFNIKNSEVGLYPVLPKSNKTQFLIGTRPRTTHYIRTYIVPSRLYMPVLLRMDGSDIRNM